MADRPFWSDDFDMDLPKVIPEARAICGPIEGLALYTNGGSTHGSLNHPSSWNCDSGLTAFFGTRGICRPDMFWTNDPIVECSAWEAFRDAWPHSYIMVVDWRVIWDSVSLRPQFDIIMGDLRGWRKHPDAAEQARRDVIGSLRYAVARLEEITKS